MSEMASHVTSISIVWSNVSSDADQRKHQSSASLAFVWGIHRLLVNSPHKSPVTRKMFPFDDVIMCTLDFKQLGLQYVPPDTNSHVCNLEKLTFPYILKSCQYHQDLNNSHLLVWYIQYMWLIPAYIFKITTIMRTLRTRTLQPHKEIDAHFPFCC